MLCNQTSSGHLQALELEACGKFELWVMGERLLHVFYSLVHPFLSDCLPFFHYWHHFDSCFTRFNNVRTQSTAEFHYTTSFSSHKTNITQQLLANSDKPV